MSCNGDYGKSVLLLALLRLFALIVVSVAIMNGRRDVFCDMRFFISIIFIPPGLITNAMLPASVPLTGCCRRHC